MTGINLPKLAIGRPPILAVDFDGTIAEHVYPNIGEPLPNAFEVLKRFMNKGDRLILWTCREGKTLREAIDFCSNNGIFFEKFNENVDEHNYARSRKIYADLYIDDRMVGNFPGWLEIEKIVDNLREALFQPKMLDVRVKSSYKFPNGIVVTFDDDNSQIAELQGVYSPELHQLIKNHSDEKSQFFGF